MKKYTSENHTNSRQLTSNPRPKQIPMQRKITELTVFGFLLGVVLAIFILDRLKITGYAIILLIILFWGLLVFGYITEIRPNQKYSIHKKTFYSPESLEKLFHTPTPIARDAALEVLNNLRNQNLLEKGILREIKLSGLDLHDVDLSFIDIKNGESEGVNFANATLSFSNLTGANLRNCHLQGADLRHALLLNADLRHVIFDETTILPDETTWTPQTDMQRFTERTHPQFWVPTWYSQKLDMEGWFSYQNKIK